MARTMSRNLGALTLAALLTAAALPVQGQTYPSGPVHLIVAYAPGGTGDVVARIVAPKLSTALGQSVVVENRAGASGAIGARSVVAATPDGLTLLVGQTAEVAINQHWLKGINYDPDKDLQPVALMTVVPLALVVPAKAPYSTMAELVAALTTSKLTFASAGTGTPGHFAGELLKAKTKGNLTHVPYKGAGPALNDLIGGHVDMYFPGMPAAMPLLKDGLVKVLGRVIDQAFGDRAGRADGRRDRRHEGFRLYALAGNFRAARHAAGGGRAAQYRDQQGAQRP